MNKLQVEVSEITLNDIKEISLLASVLYKGTQQEMYDDFLTKINNSKCKIFSAKVENAIVGFAESCLRTDYVEGTSSSPVGYLEGIYIKDAYRFMGIAGQLEDACEKWAKSKGCKEFASDCEIQNVNSMNFHFKMGFDVANKIICFTKKI